MIRTTIIAAAVAAVTLATSGCGGSDKPLTRTELVAKAEAICRHAVDTVDWRKATFDQLARLGPRLAAIEEDASSELAHLKPPASLSIDWQILIDNFRVTGEQFRKLAATAKAHGGDASFLLEPVLSAMRERAGDARTSGFRGECARY